MKKHRTLSEILIEADECTSFPRMIQLTNEISEHPYMPLKHKSFGLEHLKDLGIRLQTKKLLEL